MYRIYGFSCCLCGNIVGPWTATDIGWVCEDCLEERCGEVNVLPLEAFGCAGTDSQKNPARKNKIVKESTKEM